MATTIKQRANEHIFQTYARYPLTLVKGQGCQLWDEAGKAYIDFLAGISVCNLGHAHPRLVDVLTRQAQTLWHVSNLYYTEPQADLAAWLTAHSFADRVFFANSGAEANEAAIKLARIYFKSRGEQQRYRVVSMNQSFHGRTMATLSATGQEKVRKGFDPILEGFDFVPYNDIEALREMVGPDTCAVMMEPLQGEGGVICPEKAYMQQVRQLCNDAGCLLIFDEVQTGIGRTGKLFAYEHYDIRPDIMTLAKALGNGLPIGAMLAVDEVAAAMGPGTHASTFGGTPIVSAVALEVLKIIEEEGIVAQVAEKGAYLRDKIKALQQTHPGIVQVRGLGLLVGVELSIPGNAIVMQCMEKGFLINCIQDKVLRLAPPLIIEKDHIDAFVACLDDVLTAAEQPKTE